MRNYIIIVTVAADFGVTGKLSGDKQKMETVIGTPFFLAPEIILADKEG